MLKKVIKKMIRIFKIYSSKNMETEGSRRETEGSCRETEGSRRETDEEVTEINPVSDRTLGATENTPAVDIAAMIANAINSGMLKVEVGTDVGTDIPTIDIPLCTQDEDETYDSFIKLSKEEESVFRELLKNREVTYISDDKVCFPNSVTPEEFLSFSKGGYDCIVIDRSSSPSFISEILPKCSFIIARVIMDRSCLPSGSPDAALHFGMDMKFRSEISNEISKNEGGFTPPNFVIYTKYNMELWIWSASTTVDVHATLLDANSYTTSVQQAKKAHTIAIQHSTEPFRFRGDFGEASDEVGEGGAESSPASPAPISYTYTSGTTGEPVRVPHAAESKLLYNVSGIRELNWRGWVPTRKIVVCLNMVQTDRIDGNVHYKAYRGAEDMQRSLEEIAPSYLFTYPSIVEDLNLSRIPSLIDIKTRGEVGASCYYAEETGIIGLRCHVEPKNYHVMEHIIIEHHPDAYTGIAVTDLTNPYVKRYILDDHIEMADMSYSCPCGRKMDVIRKILGRSRNMLTNVDGDKIFPVFGDYKELLPRFQIIQVSTAEFEFRSKTGFDYYRYKALLDTLQIDLKKLCGAKEIKFTITTVDEFRRPFERFISYVK